MFAQYLDRAVLECVSNSGNPEPVITWYKDATEIVGATQSELFIREVDLGDRAVYHCVASNSFGNVTSKQAFLNIRG